MSQIYAKAKRVLVWLGEDSDISDGRTTFDVVRHLASLSEWDMVQAIMQSRASNKLAMEHFHSILFQLLPASSGPSSTTIDNREGNIPAKPCDLEYVQSTLHRFRHFFNRRYFRRLWAVQEMYHAKNGILHCGEQSMLWQTFQRGFNRLRKVSTAALVQEHRGKSILEALDGTLVERIVRMLNLRKDEAHFLEYIGLTHCTQCQDPRDRIFALSSMNISSWVQPDYSLTDDEVYTAFTKSCIEHGCCETVLHHASVQLTDPIQQGRRKDVIPSSPSWVINWQDLAMIGSSFWHDNHDDGRGRPDGYVDDLQNLWCTLTVLGTVRWDELRGRNRISYTDTHSPETIQYKLIPAVDPAMPSLIGGDVLCRISRAPAERLVEGSWQKTGIESDLLVLRHTRIDKEVHTIAPLARSLVVQARPFLADIAIGQKRKRFCIH